MPKSKEKYYAYFVPLENKEGMTTDWKTCEKIVSGKAGARFKAFSSEKEAKEWIRKGALYEARERAVLEHGIYFDAGTGRGDGVEISVTDELGKNLLHKALSEDELNKHGKHLLGNASATNNYGELLALRYALEIASQSDEKKIFGDSKLVVDYWSKWKIKKKDLPEETVWLAEEVSKMREEFEKGGGVVARVSGDDNPADLGFHR